MAKVALIKCDTYDKLKVYEAIKEGVDLIGGLDSIFSIEEKVLLKPNWVAADPPEKGSTTHPSVFYGVARLFHEFGSSLTYGDSPAFHKPETAAKKCGFLDTANAFNLELADFENGEDVLYEEATQNKKLFIAKGVLEADSIVSLPKLKSHGFARYTGSIKNQFGCVPGKLKGEMHVKLPGPIEFSRMLVDLNNYVSPKLYVMDGIVAMEGNGPRGGDLKSMNVLIISTDPVALDATVCRMIGLDPEIVATTKIGMETNMGSYLEEDIELVGEPLETFIDKDFDIVRRPLEKVNPSKMAQALNKLIVPKPYIIDDKCVKCGVCVIMCPVEGKAINWENGSKANPPVYEYDKCIRCYCCQELCPESAIHIKVPALRKIIDKVIK